MVVRAVILTSAMCVLLAGCVQPINDRATLGGRFMVPSMHAGPGSMNIHDSPDLLARTQIDRSRWRPIPFVAHFDGVVHGRTFVIRPPVHPNDRARAYGLYPDQADALDPQRHEWFDDLLEVGRDFGRTFIGSPYAAAYLVWTGELFRPSISPGAYKRTRQDAWSSGSPEPAAPMEQETDE